ncbi:MAG: nucleotidyltransferase family protein [Campylobacterales bacterium]
MTQNEIVSIIRQVQPELEQKYHVKVVGLFGSRARNEATDESDVDLLVEAEPKIEFLLGAEELLSARLGCKVDVIRQHKHLSPRFRRRVEAELVRV